MSGNKNVGLQGASTEYADPYSSAAFKRGRGLEQVIDYFNKLAQEGTYETVCIPNIAIQYLLFSNVNYSG